MKELYRIFKLFDEECKTPPEIDEILELPSGYAREFIVGLWWADAEEYKEAVRMKKEGSRAE